MGTIAKGEITLSPVNDAYTVSVAPASFIVKADFDGSNLDLDSAKGIITVKRGAKPVLFHVNTPHISTGGALGYTRGAGTSIPFWIEALPKGVESGIVDLDIETDDGFGYMATVSIAYTVVRESTMLDWIRDWDGTKTKIGDTYLMTPKLFVGNKEDVVDESVTPPQWREGALTGVYIGPDSPISQGFGAGIYGYLGGKEIFHINAQGGFIGGWEFNSAALQSSNGVVNILSEGSIYAQNPNSTTPYWGIYSAGHATFANGNVQFMADGSATFNGFITSSRGSVGGWRLSDSQLQSGHILIDSKEGYIGINSADFTDCNHITGDYYFPVCPDGGVKMWYGTANDFGLIGWCNKEAVFQIGSTNMIASWSFDNTALYLGIKQNTAHQYTAESGHITIGTSGLRGRNWYIDSNGDISFVNDLLQFNSTGGTICGWNMSASGISTADDRLRIMATGEISVSDGDTVIWKVDQSGQAVFSMGFVQFSANGSGWIANKNITWDTDGNLTIEGVLKQRFKTMNRTVNGNEILDLGVYRNFAIYQTDSCSIKLLRIPCDISYNGATIKLFASADETVLEDTTLLVVMDREEGRWLYPKGSEKAAYFSDEDWGNMDVNDQTSDGHNVDKNYLIVECKCMAMLTAIPDISGQHVNWFIENLGDSNGVLLDFTVH